MNNKNQESLGKRWWRVQEVAEYFSISHHKVYDLIHDGRLKVWHPNCAVGKRGLRISAESIAALEQDGVIDKERFNE